MLEKNVNLINNSKKGDKKSLEILINENNGLIWSVVKKFLGKGYDSDDLYQIACIGFIKAVKRFDFEFETELSTYAMQYMFGEIKKFIRDDGLVHISRNEKENGFRLKFESFYGTESCKNEIDDGLYSKEKNFLAYDEQNKVIDKIDLGNVLNNLSDREQKIINLRYFEDKTQMEVASQLGISQVHVSRIERQVLNNLKTMFLEV